MVICPCIYDKYSNFPPWLELKLKTLKGLICLPSPWLITHKREGPCHQQHHPVSLKSSLGRIFSGGTNVTKWNDFSESGRRCRASHSHVPRLWGRIYIQPLPPMRLVNNGGHNASVAERGGKERWEFHRVPIWEWDLNRVCLDYFSTVFYRWLQNFVFTCLQLKKDISSCLCIFLSVNGLKAKIPCLSVRRRLAELRPREP